MKSSLDTAIILVSEITKGMKSIGSKALLNIDNNITILDHQIHHIKKYYNPNKIILCTGFDHDKIVNRTKKYKNIKYCYNEEFVKDNQVGSLIKCLKNFGSIIDNALIISNGIILFNKIKIETESATYFIDDINKKNAFDVGANIIGTDGYLFYDLSNKWIELLFLNNTDLSKLKNNLNTTKNMNQLFLFELINFMKSSDHFIKFVKLAQSNNMPIKVNSLKDIIYAKKIYKKYTSISY